MTLTIVANKSSTFLLFRRFNLDDFPATIAPASGTNMMRQFRAITLRAIVQRRRGQPKVTAPLPLARLGVFSLR